MSAVTEQTEEIVPEESKKNEEDPTKDNIENRRDKEPSITLMFLLLQGRFCICFSLQAGVCMFSAMGWVFILSVCINNLGGEQHPEDDEYITKQYTILYFYAILMLFGFGTLYIGAVKPSILCLQIGAGVLGILSIYWIIVSAISFTNEVPLTHSVCIDKRCPETHWLFRTNWRNYSGCTMPSDSILSEDDFIIDETPEKLQEEAKKQKSEVLANHFEDAGGALDNELGDIGLSESEVDGPTGDDLMDSTSSNDTGFSLGGLEIMNFESRVIGCPRDTRLFLITSIIGFILWLLFMVYGLLGVFFLMRQIRKMANTGELDKALLHSNQPSS